MRTRANNLIILFAVVVLVSGINRHLYGASPSQSQKASALTAWGLHTTELKTKAGTIRVNLPADAAAGDTLIGTVITEPTGNDAAERAANTDKLNGEVVELGGQKIKAGTKLFHYVVPATVTSLALKFAAHKDAGQTQIPILPKAATGQEVIRAGPRLAQAGRPVQFTGAFDPNSATQATIGQQPAILLAQSPRQATLQCPNVTGPVPYQIQNGGRQAEGVLQSIRIQLSTDKPTIIKNDHANIVLTVIGVQGIRNDLPVHLSNQSPGVIQLSGGNEQQIFVSATAVQSQDEFQQKFTATGLRAGSYDLLAFLNVSYSSNGTPDPWIGNRSSNEDTCGGGCAKEHETDANGATWFWCDDLSCSSQGNCACHLVRLEEKPPGSGKFVTQDLGKVRKSNKVKGDGASTYSPDCLAD